MSAHTIATKKINKIKYINKPNMIGDASHIKWFGVCHEVRQGITRFFYAMHKKYVIGLPGKEFSSR